MTVATLSIKMRYTIQKEKIFLVEYEDLTLIDGAPLPPSPSSRAISRTFTKTNLNDQYLTLDQNCDSVLYRNCTVHKLWECFISNWYILKQTTVCDELYPITFRMLLDEGSKVLPSRQYRISYLGDPVSCKWDSQAPGHYVYMQQILRFYRNTSLGIPFFWHKVSSEFPQRVTEVVEIRRNFSRIRLLTQTHLVKEGKHWNEPHV